MINRVQRAVADAVAENLDLLGLWVIGVVVWPLVPVGHLLARDDLVPWMALNLSLALLLRGREIGAGPHPMLNPRRSTLGAWLRRGALVLAPLVMLAAYDAGRERSALYAVAMVVGVVAIATLLALGREEGETAWNPPGTSAWLRWLFLAVSLPALAGWLGVASRFESIPWASQGAPAGLIGFSFLAVGLIAGRVRNLSQRRAAGFRDGRPYRMDLFPFLLAFLGPSLGFFVLHQIFGRLGGLDFNQAYVGSLHVLVWAALIWAGREPIARTVILHEVTPTSGADPEAKGAANPFDQPPEGALRFNPLQTKRIRVLHPWVVPVRGARIADLDDPIQPLWSRSPPPLPLHILGEARFEPDAVTRGTQGEVITIALKGGDDTTTTLSEGSDGQTRRMVILRPFLPPGVPRRRRVATYAWDEDIPEQAIQVIDNTVETATLRDGDVIVISAEGVARAYEVEIGEALYSHLDAAAFRPPQLEDYVKAG